MSGADREHYIYTYGRDIDAESRFAPPCGSSVRNGAQPYSCHTKQGEGYCELMSATVSVGSTEDC